MSTPRVAIIGAGPAGLMAAEMLARGGIAVEVFDAMPTPARKFLRAGVGGLNLTHSEALPDFLARYGERAETLRPWIEAFGPAALCDWAAGLGCATFVGSSGRVFPVGMKAAPLLRAWLKRLETLGARLHARHRWLGWNEPGGLHFATPDGSRSSEAGEFAAVVFALGGGSWPRLGSDGAWRETFAAAGIAITPLAPANCGFEIAWSEHLRERFAGQPLKNVGLHLRDANGAEWSRLGECLITRDGVEGGAIYPLSRPLRETIAHDGSALLEIDLAPQRDPAQVLAALQAPRGRDSLANHLRRRLGFDPLRCALVHEAAGDALKDPTALAERIKRLPLRLLRPRPLAEAISTAGGVRFDAVDADLQLHARPGHYVIGEMLDWEAPTGGYLLTACFASGVWAARAIRARLGATAV